MAVGMGFVGRLLRKPHGDEPTTLDAESVSECRPSDRMLTGPDQKPNTISAPATIRLIITGRNGARA